MKKSVISNRIEWIDNLKALCMLCVLAVHLGLPNNLYRLFAPFFLTSFFFVSGYLKGEKRRTFKTLLKRIRSLIIPFFTFGIINLIIDSVVTKTNIIYLLIGFLGQVSGSGLDILWFVSCLIICEVIGWIIDSVFNEKIFLKFGAYIFLCGVGFGLSYKGLHFLWHVEVALVMSLFLFGGEMYKKYQSNIKYEGCVAVGCFLGYVLLLVLFPDMYIDSHLGVYSNRVIFIVSGVLAIAFLVFCCKNIYKIRFLQFVGKNTLIFYAFQIKCFTVLKKIVQSSDSIISWFLVYLGALVLLSIGAKLISRYMPILLGRRKSYEKD